MRVCKTVKSYVTPKFSSVAGSQLLVRVDLLVLKLLAASRPATLFDLLLVRRYQVLIIALSNHSYLSFVSDYVPYE